jgi:hypothetical protein
MTERGTQLHATADGQVVQLIALISALDEVALRLPCPGREKLGDGTVGACARHTADNYQRIAAFVETSDQKPAGPAPTERDGHRIPRFVRALGHGPTDRSSHGPGAGQPSDSYSADNVDLNAVVGQLAASRAILGQVATLTDSQLDAVPPKDSFRFCDGQRTFEQVLASLLKHQQHQVDALADATP